jgi:hypothetical protein
MDKVSPIKPYSVDIARWLYVVVISLVFFAPRFYDGQKQTEPMLEKSTASKQLAVSKSNLARQITQMQPKTGPALGKMMDEYTGVKIPPSLPEKLPVSVPENQLQSVHIKKAEHSLHPIILQASNRYQVDSSLVKAIIMAESNYNSKAISKRGAKGLMQLMPKTAEALGVGDSFNPEHNINAGVRYLKKLMNQFDGDVKLALAAYHAGSRKVRKYQGVPPFKATQYYIKKVFEYHQYYKYREKMAW